MFSLYKVVKETYIMIFFHLADSDRERVRSPARDMAKLLRDPELVLRDLAKVHCNFFFSHVSCGAPFVSLPSGRR